MADMAGESVGGIDLPSRLGGAADERCELAAVGGISSPQLAAAAAASWCSPLLAQTPAACGPWSEPASADDLWYGSSRASSSLEVA